MIIKFKPIAFLIALMWGSFVFYWFDWKLFVVLCIYAVEVEEQEFKIRF